MALWANAGAAKALCRAQPLIACLALSTAPAAWANDEKASAILPNTIGLHLASQHVEPGFNNRTPGLFVRWADNSGAGLGAGLYRNSERKTSAWAGYTFTTPSASALRLRGELTVGGVTGYTSAKLQLLLMPSLSAALAKDAQRETRLHLGYIPKIEKRGSAAAHLMLSHHSNFL
jgi:hypothetical protein